MALATDSYSALTGRRLRPLIFGGVAPAGLKRHPTGSCSELIPCSKAARRQALCHGAGRSRLCSRAGWSSLYCVTLAALAAADIAFTENCRSKARVKVLHSPLMVFGGSTFAEGRSMKVLLVQPIAST